MRSEEEIRDVAGRLGRESYLDDDAPDGRPVVPARDWRDDTFKFGFLMGKIVALNWVLGEPGADISGHYDFEDWRAGDNARCAFSEEQPI